METTYCPCPSCNTVNRIELDRAKGHDVTCAKCKAKIPLAHAVCEVTGEGLTALVAKATIPVVVDFWAPWCAPCLRFAPTFSEVAGELGGKFVFAKLNTESYPDASAEFGIRGIPTMIAFRGGAEAKRVSGAMAMGQFVSWLGTI